MDGLTGTERRVLATITAGEELDLRVWDSKLDDPSNRRAWDAARSIRAEFLYDLLVGTREDWRPHTRGLRLRGARITGELNLEAATVGVPLTLRDCWFDQPLALGQARLVSLRLPGTHLPGLTADQLETRGSLELTNGFRVDGQVTLLGAHIGGQLDCTDGTFNNPDRIALIGDGLTVQFSMFCRHGFNAQGEVRLVGAHIGGQLSCRDGMFTNPGGTALNAEQLTVDQNMLCHHGFHADGEVRLVGAHIGGQLDCTGGTFKNPGGTALDGQGMSAAVLSLRLAGTPEGVVDLRHARGGVLVDAQESWPTELRLDGFVYDSIDALPEVDVRQRLEWLERAPKPYSPQKYEQLAAVYRRVGQEQEARQVAIARHRARRQQLPHLARLWSWLLGITVGYGYQPWRALWWMAGFLAVGALLFANVYPQAMIATGPADQLPVFQPVVYALDTLLPIVDLRQQDFWIPNATRPWGWLALSWFWLSIAAGWALTTALVAAVTGLLKTD